MRSFRKWVWNYDDDVFTSICTRFIPDFNHLYLVVDAENKGAWNVYERAGFMHTATKEEGPIGKERLYYLDLDSKHVSSLRLTENEASSISSYSVVDLLKDNQK